MFGKIRVVPASQTLGFLGIGVTSANVDKSGIPRTTRAQGRSEKCRYGVLIRTYSPFPGMLPFLSSG
jgi:hypothetical protein